MLSRTTKRLRRLTVSKFAHDRTLHYLANQQRYDLSDVVRRQLSRWSTAIRSAVTRTPRGGE